MALLHTDTLQLPQNGMGDDFRARFQRELMAADSVRIASGYASNAALHRLDQLIHQPDVCIRHICVTLGMYADRIPASIYYAALQLNRRWLDESIGEIRLVHGFRYHGKTYLFSKDRDHGKGNRHWIEHVPFSGFVGSHNLGALAEDFAGHNQYELSVDLPDQQHRLDLRSLIERLEDPAVSTRIDLCSGLNVYRHRAVPAAAGQTTEAGAAEPIDEPIEEPVDETGEEGLPLEELVLEDHALFAYYQQHRIPGRAYDIEVNVPMDQYDTDFIHSNVNTCYSRPRQPGHSRDWYEMQIPVGARTPANTGLPAPDIPPHQLRWFYLVTDEDQLILAHRTSANGKQVSAVGSDRLLGHWFKGKFVRNIPELTPEVGDDLEHPANLITRPMVEQLGMRYLRFAETDQFIRVSPAAVRDSRNRRPYAEYAGSILVPVWTLTTSPDCLDD